MKRTHAVILCTAFVFGGLAENTYADVFLVSDATRGWFTPGTDSGTTLAGNNYRAGFCPAPPGGCNSGPAEFRDFFTFAIPQLDGPVISAVLTLSTAGVETADSPSMTYQITSIPSVFGFNDLGTGTVYGSRVYTAADGATLGNQEGTNQSITLDAAGIAAILLFDVRLGGQADSFDVGKDGRFLIPTAVEGSASPPMTVVLNWTAGLKK